MSTLFPLSLSSQFVAAARAIDSSWMSFHRIFERITLDHNLSEWEQDND